MLRKRKMALISQWKSLLENVLLNIWGRSAKGSSPISARLYGGLQTHGIHSKDHAIMDRAWNTFTQRILDPFHPSYTWYNEISTDTNRYLFLLFSPFLRGIITFAPITALFSHSWDSGFFLGDWNLKNATTRIFHASLFYQSPLSFVQRNSSQCLPTIFVGFTDNYDVLWDLTKRNLFLVNWLVNWKNSNICTVDFESLSFFFFKLKSKWMF